MLSISGVGVPLTCVESRGRVVAIHERLNLCVSDSPQCGVLAYARCILECNLPTIEKYVFCRNSVFAQASLAEVATAVELFGQMCFPSNAVREFVNKSAASAASLDYVKFQAVIKSAASAASQIQGTQVQGSPQILRNPGRMR